MDEKTRKAFEKIDRVFNMIRQGYRSYAVVEQVGPGHQTVRIVEPWDAEEDLEDRLPLEQRHASKSDVEVDTKDTLDPKSIL